MPKVQFVDMGLENRGKVSLTVPALDRGNHPAALSTPRRPIRCTHDRTCPCNFAWEKNRGGSENGRGVDEKGLDSGVGL